MSTSYNIDTALPATVAWDEPRSVGWRVSATNHAEVQREREAIDFLYRKRLDGSRHRWSDGKIAAAHGGVNPYRPTSLWTCEDVDEVFDHAAGDIIQQHREGRLRFGLTSGFCKIVIRNKAVSFVRKHGPGREGGTSLSAPIKPRPGSDVGGASATVEESIAAPKVWEPEQQLLLGLLTRALEQAVAELPERQFGALRLRELCDFDVSHVNPDLINTILDLGDGVSFTAHTSAFLDAKATLKRSLADKLGHDELAGILHTLDINLHLDRPAPRVI